MSRRRKSIKTVAAASIIVLPLGALSQVVDLQTSYTTFGTPGLIEMPTANSAPDAELSATVSHFSGTTRTTLTFQITPRLSGSFRYSAIDPWNLTTGNGTYDRSFDLRYRFVDEGRYRPAVAVGLQDFIGTGIYSGEYLVATKHLTPRLSVTGGIGWGRYGSYNGFSNPLGFLGDKFKSRPSNFSATGGNLESAKWFRGDAAFFGGLAYQATDRLMFKAEISSDDFDYDTDPNVRSFTPSTPLNLALQYKIADGMQAQAYYLYGEKIGASVTLVLNPKEPAFNGGLGPAPMPIKPRIAGAAADLGWTAQADGPGILRKNVQTLLAQQGLGLEAMELEPRRVTLRLQNPSYNAKAEAIGRAARVLSQTMPASVETFVIVPVVKGIPTSAVVLQRSDLERLEFSPDGSAQIYDRAQIIDAPSAGDGLVFRDGIYPKLRWGVGPYLSASYFDPDNPVRADAGVQVNLEYRFAPGLILSGSARKRVIGNRDKATQVSDSVLQHVRSDAGIYDREGDPALTNLQMAYYFRPGQDLYGRVTAGYLERMYGGISTELLWKPVNSRFAIGGELNYAKQRDFDQLLGFQDYDVFTGHVTGYWDFGNGFEAQVDAGRYLAGDWGTTVSVDRTFKNGWRIGAYATLTDVSSSDFGEGSFDKGLRFTVPLDHFLGKPTNRKFKSTLKPLARDGGARLDVDGRLYETVRDYHDPDLQDSWGRFWR